MNFIKNQKFQLLLHYFANKLHYFLNFHDFNTYFEMCTISSIFHSQRVVKSWVKQSSSNFSMYILILPISGIFKSISSSYISFKICCIFSLICFCDIFLKSLIIYFVKYRYLLVLVSYSF